MDPVIFSVVQGYVRRGERVWDIGANLGLFAAASAAKAGLGGRVIAVEADPWLARLLLKTADGLPATVAPLSVLCAAASSGYGVARFDIARRSRATSHLSGFGTTQTGGSRSAIVVPTIPPDALLGQFDPTFVKIDVEGAEVLVLEGLADTLRLHRPRILCEVAAENTQAVSAILGDAGYELRDATDQFQRVPIATPEVLALPV